MKAGVSDGHELGRDRYGTYFTHHIMDHTLLYGQDVNPPSLDRKRGCHGD